VTRVLAPFATVLGPSAMVVSADALASAAGLTWLARGASAVDAAIATNAVLAVTAPHLCGMGGDLFALVHDGAAAPMCLNASGRAGSGADAAALRAEGRTTMPEYGDIRAVTVPGCVDGWDALHARFGTIALDELLAPAIGYAEDGFPASALLIGAARKLARHPGLSATADDLVAQAAHVGARVRRPGVARALRALAVGGRDAFYRGEFGAGLLAQGHGHFAESDLAAPQANWVEPLSLDAWGHRLWTVPPNSQGYLTLAGAWVAAGLELPHDPSDAAWAHLLVEAARVTGHDRPAVLAESSDGATLLRLDRLAERRAEIQLGQAGPWSLPDRHGDTTYLGAVDRDGRGVSLIQSNASGFGSRLFEPATGIGLHNRGLGFSLEAGHPAEYGPGRRPPHTLSPILLTRPNGALAGVLGTQGGDAQPQILLQLLTRMLHLGQTPGEAVAAARWVLAGEGSGFDTWTSGHRPSVSIEEGAPDAWASGLVARGHPVAIGPAFDSSFGHANVILRRDDGMLSGAADPRAVVGAAIAC